MQDDRKTLEDLNHKIGEMEHQGDRDAVHWLDSILAPQLAFRRADRKTFYNRDEFLEAELEFGKRHTPHGLTPDDNIRD